LFWDVPCGFTNLSIRIGYFDAETNVKYKNNNNYCYYYYYSRIFIYVLVQRRKANYKADSNTQSNKNT